VREFVVTLRDGRRYTVRAARVAFLDQNTVGLMADPAPETAPDPAAGAVAVFDRRLVASVIAADHLVSEAKAEAVDPPWVIARDADPDSDIPF
jgi:hypothetical protein